MADCKEFATLKISDITQEGHGVGRTEDGMAIFVPGAYPGDVVEVGLDKVKKRYATAHIEKLIEASPDRLASFCPYDSDCGGCPLGRYRYEAQLSVGAQHVRDVLTRIGGIEEPEVEPMTGLACPDLPPVPVRYRNKAVIQLGTTKGQNGHPGKPLAGYYARKSHRIINADGCLLQTPAADAALDAVRQYMKECRVQAFNPRIGRGLLKDLTIRSSFETGEVMAVLRMRGRNLPNPERFCELLDDAIAEAPNGGCRNIPDDEPAWSLESVWLKAEDGKKAKLIHLAGKRTIADSIGEADFEIPPEAFWQVNGKMTEPLYAKVFEYADLAPDDRVLDLYCGMGSIGLYLSKRMEDRIRLVGIEVNEDAVLGANRSAVINHVVNARYFAGKAEQVLPELLTKHTRQAATAASAADGEPVASEEEPSGPPEIPVPDLTEADLVILDPPRAGCEESLLQATCEQVKPQRIVYVSCEPGTMARDIKFLCANGYRFEKAAPFDMFPNTGRLETVSLLVRK